LPTTVQFRLLQLILAAAEPSTNMPLLIRFPLLLKVALWLHVNWQIGRHLFSCIKNSHHLL